MIEKKQNVRAFFQKALGFFTLYAFLPLFCGGIVALLFWINSVGSYEAEAMFLKAGDQAVSAVIGTVSEKKVSDIGFYFPSAELIPPGSEKIQMLIGSATYFSPISTEAETEKTEETEKTPTEVKAEKEYDSVPAGATAVVRANLASNTFAINDTDYTLDPTEIRNTPFPYQTKSETNGPLVLVLHTHGTESYFEDNTNLSDFAQGSVESYFLENETTFRSENPEKTVVQVGKAFSSELNSLGIPTLHCTVMHDKDDFNSAYVYSAETVKRMLAEYPSIQYVIDLHRDSIVRGEDFIKSYTKLDGKDSAQVMVVVGTNQNGRHPNWRENLVIATAWKDQMDKTYPSLSRSLYLKAARFNQEYLPGCLLLEVGSAANTLEEAENAARLAAAAFSRMIKERGLI